MAIPALLIGTAAVILLLGVMVAARSRMNEATRQRLERYLSEFVDETRATSHDAVVGRHQGMEIEASLHHHTVDYAIQLRPAGVSYRLLLERYADASLVRALANHSVHVDANGRLHGIVTREAGLGETMAAIGTRVQLAARVQALRVNAPREMLVELPRIRAARDVDRVLESLERLYPDAPETREAHRIAAERYHDKRFQARVRPWIGAAS